MKQRIIAAFDFDGTITTRDSLLPFLIYSTGLKTTYLYLASLIPTFIGFLLHIVSRQQVKERVLTKFFSGLPISWIHGLGDTFSHSKALEQLIKPNALQRIQWHLQQGHECILISANLNVYLDPWAKRMGFSHVISSNLESTPAGLFTGNLQGLNCWGPEKVRRLQDLLGPRNQYILYAYGDSRGDKELLAFADHPFYKSKGY